MATTDARTGFRLPWSSDPRPDSDASTDDGASPQESSPTDEQPTDTTAQADPGTDPEETTMTELTATEQASPDQVAAVEAPKPPRRPSKFLADLTKAMQSAAEAAREESVGRLQSDAKAAIEDIHGRSSTEAADLRRRADDDVSAIREWSKQEIARIREETETKVSDRKAQLEREIEEHAALIERQIDRVQGRVTAFEQEMASFFERLLAEDDPTRFAEMAESLPEPPPFDADDGWVPPAAEVSVASFPAEVGSDETGSGPITGPDGAPTGDPADAGAATVGQLDVSENSEGSEGSATGADGQVDTDGNDAEAAMAAIQAAAEAAEATERGDNSSGGVGIEAVTGVGADENSGEPATIDPRLAAFGLSADFEAAEAEAAAAVQTSDEAEEIPVIADDALAARLAGLVPEGGTSDAAPSDSRVTQVVVSGLVSVASIASFKRHLGRLAGVQGVGVSSGPEGEFIFAVTHGPDIVLRDAVPAMPGFQARVTGGSDDTVEVTARDPESEG
jgi:hypothetical protein